MNCQIYTTNLKLHRVRIINDTDYSVDMQQFEDQYFEVKAKLN